MKNQLHHRFAGTALQAMILRGNCPIINPLKWDGQIPRIDPIGLVEMLVYRAALHWNPRSSTYQLDHDGLAYECEDANFGKVLNGFTSAILPGAYGEQFKPNKHFVGRASSWVKTNASGTELLFPDKCELFVENGVLTISKDGPALTEFDPEKAYFGRSAFEYYPFEGCPVFLRTLACAVGTAEVGLLQELLGCALFRLAPHPLLLIQGVPATIGAPLAKLFLRVAQWGNLANYYLADDSLESEVEVQPGVLLVRPKFNGNPFSDEQLGFLASNLGQYVLRGTPAMQGLTMFSSILIDPMGRHLPSSGDVDWSKAPIHCITLNDSDPGVYQTAEMTKEMDETPGIFNWIVEGAVRLLQKNGEIRPTRTMLQHLEAVMGRSKTFADARDTALHEAEQDLASGNSVKGAA